MPKALTFLLAATLLAALAPAPGLLAAPGKDAYSFFVPAGWSANDADAAQRELLGKMRGLLDRDKTLEVRITGFTDSLGATGENLAIGYHYAERVGFELVRLGFPKDRLRPDSLGAAEPVKRGGWFEDQAPNRRVKVSLEAAAVKAVAAQGRAAGGKKVFITEPAPGRTDRAYQKVKAIVEGGAKTALLTINGESQIIPVHNSRVESEAVLDKGNNSIEVTAWDETGASGKDRVDLEYVPPPPQVVIETPRDGDEFDTTESPVIRVRGKVSSAAPLQEAWLFLNGTPRRITVEKNGSFVQPIVLIQEQNALRVEAVDIFGKVATSEEIKIRAVTLNPKDLVVFLTWDREGVDIDLHANGPEGKHTWYGALDPFDNADAIPGGALDIDNKVGFGPEVFTLLEGKKGIYTFEARYHHSLKDDPTEALMTVVLHPNEPSRRVVRVFGPQPVAPGAKDRWNVIKVRMPEGIFEEK